MKPTIYFRLCLSGLLFLFLSFVSHTGLGQVISSDSSRISYEEEEEAQSDFSLKERYNYLVRSKIEETRLWKLGLNAVGFDYGGFRYGVYLIYERKLSTSFSVLGELSPTSQPGYRYLYDPTTMTATWDRIRYLNLGAQVAGRYYFDLQKRIRKGKSANNFSANYLTVGVKTSAAYGPRNLHNYSYFNYEPNGYFMRTPVLSGRYGLQRRLGRYGFIDGNVGLATSLTFLSRYPRSGDVFYWTGEFRIGLALGK